ncbi:MAG TPA: glutamine--fructose-6-phosphate aminotransferase, partial [Candidatus Marinimicrobia bacterium]|nr:glutamine--fructose-6-phosphate aminotransferase [Candidatus Neomarinimicrobiota bacterium]
MCGIVGYIGKRNAVPLVMEGLKRLEYRGYDSCGIAVVNNNRLEVEKIAGKVDDLQAILAQAHWTSEIAIGHTRWATHGAPDKVNAHPHVSMAGDVAVVHNGIIENYLPLKRELQNNGYQFKSETDT